MALDGAGGSISLLIPDSRCKPSMEKVECRGSRAADSFPLSFLPCRPKRDTRANERKARDSRLSRVAHPICPAGEMWRSRVAG
jgi:hypothetical protein